jgi:hypothetical protein
MATSHLLVVGGVALLVAPRFTAGLVPPQRRQYTWFLRGVLAEMQVNLTLLFPVRAPAVGGAGRGVALARPPQGGGRRGGRRACLAPPLGAPQPCSAAGAPWGAGLGVCRAGRLACLHAVTAGGGRRPRASPRVRAGARASHARVTGARDRDVCRRAQMRFAVTVPVRLACVAMAWSCVVEVLWPRLPLLAMPTRAWLSAVCEPACDWPLHRPVHTEP